MLSDKELDHIAGLARIKIPQEKRESLRKDLSSILDYIEKLNQVDTSLVEPLYQTTGLSNSTRKDEVRLEFPMDDNLEKRLLGQAPDRSARFIKVPSVIKK